MKLRLLTLCLLMAGPAFAGRVITYTATSTISQEDANNAAIAGVAKQISAQVQVDQLSQKSEADMDGQDNFNQSYKSQSRVSSDIKLKGFEIIPGRSDNGYKSTVNIDLDVFTADLQLKIRTLQQEVTELEESAQKAINDRLYHNAARSIEKIKPLLKQHENVLEQLSMVYPVDDSHKLHHKTEKLETLLIDRLSKIKISGPSRQFNLSKPEMPAWDVVVTDEFGILPSFPLIAKQDNQPLSERRTNDKGMATFNLRNVNINNGPNFVTVEPNLPGKFLKSAGIQNSIDVSYTVTQTKCSVQLECNAVANICNAIEKGLSKSSIFTSRNDDGFPLTVQVSAQEKNTLGNLISYNMNITLRGNGVFFSESPKGAGKNEVDVLVRTINKLDFSKLQSQLESSCK
ncbi:MAG: hypothetical protein HUK20_08415 [Fibrobacter sp.]|mgnify:CR=1 FL=1|nr:hypothetical protein [Fibrobacter sp.]